MCLHLWKEIIQLFIMVSINCPLDNTWNHMGYGHLGMPVGVICIGMLIWEDLPGVGGTISRLQT